MRLIPPLLAVLVLVGLLALLVAGTSSATELRDAELIPGGSPVLRNDTSTVQLEDARLGRLGPPVFVPEPGALWQLGSGIGLLVLIAERRRRCAAPDTDPMANPGRVDPNAPRRRVL